MHQVNISPPLGLARFFLTRQLIYKSKIEKHNVSLDIFVSDTSIARNLHLPRFMVHGLVLYLHAKLEKKHFSYIKDPFSSLGSDFGIYLCCWKSKNVLGSGPYHREKNICIDQ